ncbi:Uncharacterised protein [Streptococcus pneumoniae]|nr:Uncharacterised protein [Streptococcus pneumoniae]CIV88300.1 Uncharacterised protein [Streptococcus pneumoniae]CJG48947.1 Uncharacterised protein [Streptococcus pneumoniae]CJG76681.1 Uncharacterised protein [Streptococcus pneumoniae]COH61439.1 Uncharacterised protein [Streptococcus pneumoniae]
MISDGCLTSVIKNGHDFLSVEILSNESQFPLLVGEFIPGEDFRQSGVILLEMKLLELTIDGRGRGRDG